MRKKIIFLDIDGTLTEPGSNVPPESAMKAVRGAQEKGHYVFLCTGRNYDMLSPLLPLGFDGMVASCGGYVRFKDQVIYDCPMTEEQKERAMTVYRRGSERISGESWRRGSQQRTAAVAQAAGAVFKYPSHGGIPGPAGVQDRGHGRLQRTV